jgi:hypothetical protein
MIRLLCLLCLLSFLQSCAVAGGIFKAGVWVGIFVVILVIALIFWMVGKRK